MLNDALKPEERLLWGKEKHGSEGLLDAHLPNVAPLVGEFSLQDHHVEVDGRIFVLASSGDSAGTGIEDPPDVWVRDRVSLSAEVGDKAKHVACPVLQTNSCKLGLEGPGLGGTGLSLTFAASVHRGPQDWRPPCGISQSPNAGWNIPASGAIFLGGVNCPNLTFFIYITISKWKRKTKTASSDAFSFSGSVLLGCFCWRLGLEKRTSTRDMKT